LSNEKIQRLLARYNVEHQYHQEPLIDLGAGISLTTEVPMSRLALKTAAGFPPPPPGKGGGMPPGLEDSGGGGGVSTKRNIPQDHPYEPKALKPMAKALWATSMSLGHAITALRHMSRIKSSTVSPDGMLGGRGYVMPVPDVRKTLQAAVEGLSKITDTLHDEITAPHWKPRLAQLDENEAEDVENFVQKSEQILEDPEQDAEEAADEIEHANDKEGEEDEDIEDDEPASDIPGGGAAETNEAPAPAPKDEVLKTASTHYNYFRQANSSLPVETLSGPRIEHLDREDGDPNPPEAYPNDDWGQPGQREYDYPSPWDNDLRQADSGMPIDPTPTDAWDFGLGYGARGEGAENDANPTEDGKGVWGPHSGLPGTPAGSSGDTTPALDSELSRHQARIQPIGAYVPPGVYAHTLPGIHSQSELPNDGERPVARSDYYRGDKGNQITYSQSELPAEATPGVQVSPGLMNTDYVYEDLETPYTTYDYTTHNYRNEVHENG